MSTALFMDDEEISKTANVVKDMIAIYIRNNFDGEVINKKELCDKLSQDVIIIKAKNSVLGNFYNKYLKGNKNHVDSILVIAEVKGNTQYVNEKYAEVIIDV